MQTEVGHGPGGAGDVEFAAGASSSSSNRILQKEKIATLIQTEEKLRREVLERGKHEASLQRDLDRSQRRHKRELQEAVARTLQGARGPLEAELKQAARVEEARCTEVEQATMVAQAAVERSERAESRVQEAEEATRLVQASAEVSLSEVTSEVTRLQSRLEDARRQAEQDELTLSKVVGRAEVRVQH